MATFNARPVSMAERNVDGMLSKAWRLGWGLVFILTMAVLSEWGPRIVLSKAGPAPMIASQPSGRCIK
jgi:hypothetical protein